MKKLIALSLITLFACLAPAQAQITKEKRAEIDKMLRVTGAEQMMNQIMPQMINMMANQMPTVPIEFWKKFESKIDVHELLEKIIPVYDKYYTLDDLKAINAFYESPAGKKVIASLPKITQESMVIGQEWGAKVAKQAGAEAQAEMNKKK